uniref:Uncharacterized protein n=1 Tax=Vespula pensylvanica TaxID=30213 RepID=A0A834UAN8_VESPE|nr:hypothetical protein H0235_008345 [Vespula pensylvanica]
MIVVVVIIVYKITRIQAVFKNVRTEISRKRGVTEPPHKFTHFHLYSLRGVTTLFKNLGNRDQVSNKTRAEKFVIERITMKDNHHDDDNDDYDEMTTIRRRRYDDDDDDDDDNDEEEEEEEKEEDSAIDEIFRDTL